jgi:hypothetical protein
MAFSLKRRRSPTPSLRANGSRECAPDDRLREAIHSFFTRRDGLLRGARNDDWRYFGAAKFANGASAYTTSPPTIVSTDLIIPISLTGAVR